MVNRPKRVPGTQGPWDTGTPETLGPQGPLGPGTLGTSGTLGPQGPQGPLTPWTLGTLGTPGNLGTLGTLGPQGAHSGAEIGWRWSDNWRISDFDAKIS